jgi:hypothetical protein
LCGWLPVWLPHKISNLNIQIKIFPTCWISQIAKSLKSQHFEMFINNFCNIIQLFVAMFGQLVLNPSYHMGNVANFRKTYNNNNNSPIFSYPIHYTKNWLLVVPRHNWCQTLSTSLPKKLKSFLYLSLTKFCALNIYIYIYREFQKFWKW